MFFGLGVACRLIHITLHTSRICLPAHRIRSFNPCQATPLLKADCKSRYFLFLSVLHDCLYFSSGANYQRKEHRIMQHHVEHNRDLASNQNVIPV